MAKRQPRRTQQTSDPDMTDAGAMTAPSPGTHHEVLDATSENRPAEVDDRSRNTASAPSQDPDYDVTYDDIAARAYDLWVRRGHAPGGDFGDWIQAECELRDERKRR